MAEPNHEVDFLHLQPRLDGFYLTIKQHIHTIGDVEPGLALRSHRNLKDFINYNGYRTQSAPNRNSEESTRILVLKVSKAAKSILGLVTSPEHQQFGRAIDVKASELGIGQANDGSFKEGAAVVVRHGDQDPSVVLTPFPTQNTENLLRRVLGVNPDAPGASLAEVTDIQTINLAAQALHALNGFQLDTELAP